jgi:hypothetical protein
MRDLVGKDFIGFDLKPGSMMKQAEEIAYLNNHVEHIPAGCLTIKPFSNMVVLRR